MGKFLFWVNQTLDPNLGNIYLVLYEFILALLSFHSCMLLVKFLSKILECVDFQSNDEFVILVAWIKFVIKTLSGGKIVVERA
jgi:hypothetical protein